MRVNIQCLCLWENGRELHLSTWQARFDSWCPTLRFTWMPIIIYLVFVIDASIGLARFLHFKSAAEGRATGRAARPVQTLHASQWRSSRSNQGKDSMWTCDSMNDIKDKPHLQLVSFPGLPSWININDVFTCVSPLLYNRASCLISSITIEYLATCRQQSPYTSLFTVLRGAATARYCRVSRSSCYSSFS
jgi:hypothetical protein